SLDYAISQQAVEFGSTHRLALTLQWGGGAKASRSARSEDSSSSWKTAPDASDWLILPMGSY
ncbi:MAG: hypothetical protein WC881_11625, partial [Elusimicrobiota bacterium]